VKLNFRIFYGKISYFGESSPDGHAKTSLTGEKVGG